MSAAALVSLPPSLPGENTVEALTSNYSHNVYLT